ncbi:polysaccharide biosynthesis C-terminal domain-containing protein [Clostridium perfringens]|uniref:polysaccharide biosynthesis C-terminal domain-containing protein n=1 Tax=Clostridium perfringens TaxID=1502 RepID=UPI0022E3E1A6|nr:polysaccharide biosynthesis C-terminal domain-containing protein [Clostridium perfringens]
MNNTDIIVLTLFSSLDNVSVYAIYNLVVTGVKQAFLTLTTGISSLIGNMLAKDEIELLNKTFSKLEWLIHTGCALLFGITLVLIVPFVEVYTVGINDVNYIVPVFGWLITLAQAIYCIRIPYNIVVLAAGHYKQTQVSAIVEMCINIIVSCVLVIRFGLVGVAIGTLLAMSYRTIYFSWYLSKNILFRSIKYFYKHVFVDIISIILIFGLTSSIRMTQITYIAWVIYATKVGFVALIIVLVINILLYREIIISFVKDILNKPY